MKTITRLIGVGAPALIGYGIFSLSGVVLWFFTMYWFLQWWGFLGLFAGLFIPVLATLFPFIYWWQESFPTTYILIWLVGVVALLTGIMLTSSIATILFGKSKKRSPAARPKKLENIIEGETTDQ